MTNSSKNRWHHPFKRLSRALPELIVHVIVVSAELGAIRIVEEVAHRLWGPTERIMFGLFPLRYVFDGADLAVLGYFLFYGGYLVVRAYTTEE